LDPAKRVAIVGTSHSWNRAPFDDPSIEIWGVNNGFLQLADRRKSRWFDVHHIEHLPDGTWTRRWNPVFRGQPVGSYIQSLAGLGCPVYMQQTWPEVPASVRFPIERVTGYFGTYITNSISMQLAYALTEGFGEIQLWGVDMSVGTEWNYQRPNAEYFIGMAIALGCKVLIPAECDVLKTLFMYAYGEQDRHAWTKRTDTILEKSKEKRDRESAELRHMEQALEAKRAAMNQHIGFVQGVKETRALWVATHPHYPE